MEQKNLALSKSARKERIIKTLLIAAVIVAAIAVVTIFLGTNLTIGVKGLS